MPEEMSAAEERLLARAMRMRANEEYIQHLWRLSSCEGADNAGELLNAAFKGAIDAMLYDDQMQDERDAPLYSGTRGGRVAFFGRHWQQLRLE